MANPSLQIGNSNWAIKENDLLGYSTAGTRFLPQPITMTRASAGTRVNPQGLIEIVELLGSELVINGDFATDSDWYLLTGSTISGGVGNVLAKGDLANTGGNWCINQNVGMVTGSTYKVSFKARQTVGTGNFQVGQAYQKGFNQSITSVFVDYSFYITALDYGGNTGKITIGGETVSDEFEVDNVSIKESTKNNLARVDYDGTASSLLVEPERINLVTYSEDFSNAIWTNTAAAISVNPTADLSPDGTLSGNEFDEGTSSNRRALFEDLSVTANQIHTLSVFVKKGTSDYFRLVIAENGDATNWTGVQVDLSDNSLSTNNGNTNSFTDISSAISSTDYNGYYRLQLTAKHSTVTNLRLLFCTSNGAAIASGNSYGRLDYTGTSKTVYVWGAQVERGSYPTSYIPTSGTTVTRVADQYLKTGISNLIGQTEGVIFLDFELQTTNEDIVMMNIYNEATPTNSIYFYITSGNRLTAYCDNSGNQVSITSSVLAQGRYKAAFSYKANDCKFYLNGSLVGVDVSSTIPTCSGFRLINLASSLIYQEKIGIYNAQIYNTALSPSQLIALTS